MNPDASTKRMISRALIIIEEAEYLQGRQAWNMVVRRSQEVVELALKASLLWAQIEVPRIHDVGPLLKQFADRYPEPFRGHSLLGACPLRWLPTCSHPALLSSRPQGRSIPGQRPAQRLPQQGLDASRGAGKPGPHGTPCQ